MSLDAFVSMMDQVHRALSIPSDAIIIAHSFGVIQTLEFLRRWPHRAGGAVLSDWVPSQEQAAKRDKWCDETELCRMYKPELEEPWRRATVNMSLTNKLLGRKTWGPYGNGTGGFLQTWDVRAALTTLRGIPTLSFGGQFDIVDPEDVRDMAGILGGDYVYVPDAGHFSFVDRRDLWISSFRRWLEKLHPVDNNSQLASRQQASSEHEQPVFHLYLLYLLMCASSACWLVAVLSRVRTLTLQASSPNTYLANPLSRTPYAKMEEA